MANVEDAQGVGGVETALLNWQYDLYRIARARRELRHERIHDLGRCSAAFVAMWSLARRPLAASRT